MYLNIHSVCFSSYSAVARPETYSEFSQAFYMVIFVKIVNGFSLLTIKQKAWPWMFDWVLDTPLAKFLKIVCPELSVNYRLFSFIFN